MDASYRRNNKTFLAINFYKLLRSTAYTDLRLGIVSSVLAIIINFKVLSVQRASMLTVIPLATKSRFLYDGANFLDCRDNNNDNVHIILCILRCIGCERD